MTQAAISIRLEALNLMIDRLENIASTARFNRLPHDFAVTGIQRLVLG